MKGGADERRDPDRVHALRLGGEASMKGGADERRDRAGCPDVRRDYSRASMKGGADGRRDRVVTAELEDKVMPR